MDISDSDSQVEAIGDDRPRPPGPEGARSSRQSPAKPSTPTPFHEQKWSRTRQHYNDAYLDIFKATFEPVDEESLSDDLVSTQLGAVLWEATEKARLFNAISRHGRHDLQAISNLIESKSEVEVKAYLDHLRERETEQQLFADQAKNISHAEIPAAVEVGPECESLLDQAAEALEAFQEQYDSAVGQRDHQLWLVDSVVAAEWDHKIDQLEAVRHASDEETADEVERPPLSLGLFHLSRFLTLSERLFMNQGHDGAETWHSLAEERQRPAVTMNAFADLYNLIANFTRKLVQTSLFIAKSRIKSSASLPHEPGRLVKSEDVSAALNVLDLKRNSMEFWAGVARRNGLSIVQGAHKKGINDHAIISYDEVEARLSVVTPAGPLSSTSSEDSSHMQDTWSEVSDEDDNDTDERHSPILPADESMSSANASTSSEDASEVEEEEGDGEVQARHMPGDEPSVSIPRQNKSPDLEQEQDEYLERLDQNARRQEEARLLQALGLEYKGKFEEDTTTGLGKRPRVPRKTLEESHGWSVLYQAEWERPGGILSAEAFEAAGSRIKKRKLDPDAM